MPAEKRHALPRRRLLQGVGIGMTAGVAGYIGDDDDDVEPVDDDDDTVPADDDDTVADDDDDVEPDDDDDVEPDERPIQPEFITATESEATDLHLYHIIDVHSSFRVGTLLDGAYGLWAETDEFYPGWVESIDVEDDQVYTYTLHDNLEFGAGYGQMTAEDWEFHWDAVMRQAAVEDNNWVLHGSPGDWAVVDDLWAEDDLTFVIELVEPDPLWIQTPAMWNEWIYPKGLVEPYWERHQDGDEDAGADLAEDDEVLNFEYTGNLGPYSFEFREPEDRWVVSRNEDYYRRGLEPHADLYENAPYFEQYTIRTIEETTTRMAELEVENLSGLTTSSPIPPDEAQEVGEWEHINTFEVPSPFNFHTAYNQRANGWDPFRNREVRRAFSLAIDKELISDTIYHGAASPGHTFQPEWSGWFDDSEVEPIGVGDSYDPEQARTILEDELDEYEYDGDSLVDMDGEQVELTLVHRERHGPEDDTGAYHAAEYEDLGFSINREVVPTPVFFEEYMDQEDADGNLAPNAGDRDEFVSRRDWDVMWSLGLNTYPRSPMLVSLFWGTDALFNYMGWVEPDDVDIATMVAETEASESAMQETLGEVYGILSRELPANYTIFTNDVAGFHTAVQTDEEEPVGFGWGNLSDTWYKDQDIF